MLVFPFFCGGECAGISDRKVFVNITRRTVKGQGQQSTAKQQLRLRHLPLCL